jgi:hypothetical protein
MDVSRAQLSNLGDAIALDDPAFPWKIRVILSRKADKPHITSLTVESRGETPVTSTALGKIPVKQIAAVAASALLGQGDEARYRMLAQPRPDGARSWPRDHYRRVARVASWARRIGRDGGEAGAVSEFWGVCPRTARRWISRSEGRRPSSQTQLEPSPVQPS